ncbi:MAG: hypothetical protein WCR27_01350 [Eubacteriales bacterium]
MWERFRRELQIEYYWYKRHSVKNSRLNSPVGFMGILCVGSGIILMIIIGQAFASIFRNLIPIVSGTQVTGVYWNSIIFALKLSLIFMIFIISLVGTLFYKFYRRKQ